MARCGSCGKPITPRWRTCPWCKGVTGQPWHPSFPYLDKQLSAFRWFGLPMGLWAGFVAVLLYMQNPLLGVGAGIFAGLMIGSHALLPLHPWAWRLAELVWAILAIGVAVTLRQDAALALLSLIPGLVLALMLVMRRKMLDRLAGVPPARWKARRQTPRLGPCSVCGRASAQVMAPRYVMSMLFATASFPGKFRCLCPFHARLYAIPATVFSALLGWWGFPWGFVWTPQAILQNVVAGGVGLDSNELDEMWRREALEGGANDFMGAVACAFGLVLVPAIMIVPTMPYIERLLFP